MHDVMSKNKSETMKATKRSPVANVVENVYYIHTFIGKLSITINTLWQSQTIQMLKKRNCRSGLGLWKEAGKRSLFSVSILFSHDESEKRLPKSCLVLLCKYEPALRWSRDCDNTLYQGLVEILIPDVLRPIPSELAFQTLGH